MLTVEDGVYQSSTMCGLGVSPSGRATLGVRRFLADSHDGFYRAERTDEKHVI